MSENSFFNIPKMTANIPSQIGNLNNITPQTPEQGGNISGTLPKISGNVLTSSASIDYEVMKKAIDEYMSKLSYVTDVVIGSDGTAEVLKNDKQNGE